MQRGHHGFPVGRLGTVVTPARPVMFPGLALGRAVVGGNDAFTKLLLHADGADGSTSFVDSSASAHTVTPSGNAQIDTAQSKFGGASALFDGTGDWLSLDGSADFSFGTGDFVIDFWLRLNATGTFILADFNHTQGPFVYTSGANLIYHGNGATRITGTGVLSTATWLHIAALRSGGTTRLFVGGSKVGSDYADSNNYAVSANCPKFGAHADGSGAFALNGWLDEIRVSKGTDRGWAGGFTPPSAAYG